ncbi:odorant receptor 131-2-like [Periophthalmus magnuspinnatus]|uniref:odorant receptor 131-2-like n=1 Tax=Periophthalmus magnuspinnatus TaxID=409849 RepID=UPI00145B4992|nr:odorant receptor 131-2-like [Periophthalmus magnuspinnatus]
MISFRFAFAVLTNLAALIFLVINGIIIHTLCSRPVFRETSRYMLLLNLVVGDSIVLFMGQLLYMHSTANVNLSYPLCGFYVMITYLCVKIAPLTLTVMSTERYISVCFPFHYPTIVTMRNTAFAILCVWGMGCVDILIQVLLLVEFPFHLLPSLQMNSYCSSVALLLGPRSKVYQTISTIVLFLLSGLVIMSSFIGVMVVALSASTEKESANKAQNMLLVHMFQLSLNLMSITEQPIFRVVAALANPGRLFVMVHVFLVMMPRCLTTLTYGLKDSSLRPVLVSHLCCHLQVSPNTVTAHRHDLQKKMRPPPTSRCAQNPCP